MDIDSKILLQAVLYNDFSQIVEFRSTLWPSGVNSRVNVPLSGQQMQSQMLKEWCHEEQLLGNRRTSWP
jgi:hypothetical protein